jgi:AraC-like DNA-binding protein/mannose-6-phosphate isomerase-like protein (cupin superfamily)
MWLKAKRNWEDGYTVITPQITADGNHRWPFDLSFPIDVRFFRFGGRNRIRMNRHDYSELLCLLSGELLWQVQDRQVIQKEGDLIVIGSTLYHRPWASPGRYEKAVVLYFLPELVEHGDASGEAAEYLMPFRIQDAAFPHVVPARTGIPAQALELMKLIHAELPAITNRSRLTVKTYLKMILISLMNHYSDYGRTHEVFERRQAAIQRLGPLFDLLEKHFNEMITIESAADVVGMSQSHFRRFFKQVTGQSFVTYVNHFRIAKAQHLLATTEKSILEISEEVGFCDQSYFGTVFRRLVRTPPLQYRRATSHGSENAQSLQSHTPPALIADPLRQALWRQVRDPRQGKDRARRDQE